MVDQRNARACLLPRDYTVGMETIGAYLGARTNYREALVSHIIPAQPHDKKTRSKLQALSLDPVPAAQQHAHDACSREF